MKSRPDTASQEFPHKLKLGKLNIYLVSYPDLSEFAIQIASPDLFREVIYYRGFLWYLTEINDENLQLHLVSCSDDPQRFIEVDLVNASAQWRARVEDSSKAYILVVRPSRNTFLDEVLSLFKDQGFMLIPGANSWRG